MKILGLNLGHDSGAALIHDGKIIAAINEERLSRIKMHQGMPFLSINEILSIGGICFSDLDVVCIEGKSIIPVLLKIYKDQADWKKKILNIFNIEKYILGTKAGIFVASLLLAPSTFLKRLNLEKYFRSRGFKGTFNYYDHHMCHAAGAYFTQEKKDGLVITLDASGEGFCSRVFICKSGDMRLVHSLPCYHSPAYYYAYITKILGYIPLRHEGKITGLAAHGKSNKVIDILKKFIKFDSSTISFINTGGFDQYVIEKLKTKLKNFSKEDVAAGIQTYTEALVLNYISACIERFWNNKPCNIFLAGGLFANVKINQRIYEFNKVKSLYIFPNMGDGGLGLGSALSFYGKKVSMNTLYLGRRYDPLEIETLLKKYKLKYKKSKNISREIAEAINNNKIVARFSGAMEYGPRALGNRSILYSARDKSVNTWLNKKLNRTEFMPFAPVIRDVDAKKFFNIISNDFDAYRDMTVTCNVTQYCAKFAPAITHVDGTARPQILSEKYNQSYYQILSEYKKISGECVLVNTSFNLHEEPIVNTPEEAIETFISSNLDFLAIDTFLCQRSKLMS